MLKKLLHGALNIFWPLSCEGCGCAHPMESKVSLCEECLSQITRNKPPFCKKCGRSLFGEKEYADYCRDCKRQHFFFERAYSACIYDGLIKEALHDFKYNKNIRLGRTLASILLAFFEKEMPSEKFECLVPIPLYGAKEREREFNQSLLLAEPIAKKCSIPLASRGLHKVKATPSQTTLTKVERLSSQRGVFVVREPYLLYKKNVLLVDDIYTTGSTLNEAALTLKQAGATEVYGLTLLRG